MTCFILHYTKEYGPTEEGSASRVFLPLFGIESCVFSFHLGQLYSIVNTLMSVSRVNGGNADNATRPLQPHFTSFVTFYTSVSG